MNEQFDSTYANPTWFTTSAEISGYTANSSLIHEVQIAANLKLVNITSTIFHDDFMNRVLINIPDDKVRMRLLLPLGLPDLDMQKKTIQELADNTSGTLKTRLHNCLQMSSSKDAIKLFGNHHRLSIDITDKSFINFVRKAYPGYNGIIAPVNWPSCFHDDNFPMEVCIFNPSIDCKLIASHKSKAGGGKKSKLSHPTRHGYYRWNKYDQKDHNEFDIPGFDDAFKDMQFNPYPQFQSMSGFM